jgi:uncharacterized protein YndB with AHSA1/START domain
MTHGKTPGLVVTTPSDLEIRFTRSFRAPRKLVFEAWTRCEHLRRWYGPRDWELVVCELDLREGGKWRFVSRGPDGFEMGQYGEYLEVVVPERLVQTERFEGPVFDEMGGGTLNTLVFEEMADTTTVSGTVRYRTREARDAALRTPMEAGMAEGFDRLEELLARLV